MRNFEKFKEMSSELLVRTVSPIACFNDEFIVYLMETLFHNDYNSAWKELKKRPHMFYLMQTGFHMYTGDEQLCQSLVQPAYRLVSENELFKED